MARISHLGHDEKYRISFYNLALVPAGAQLFWTGENSANKLSKIKIPDIYAINSRGLTYIYRGTWHTAVTSNLFY